ncbi:MAG: inositol monophosphatase family protein [Candidatus Nezhaarchaeota archaeon]|nr:inositol monophosphatase family protein [Candidatus Nezhaarchaeota archaeon]
MFRDAIVDALKAARAKFMEVRGSDEAYKPLGIGAGGDVSRVIDMEAENAIVEVLKERLRDFTLISEESGFKEFGRGGYFVVVDPIDGSTNAVRGYPACSSAVAIAEGRTLKDIAAAGVMNLVTGDIYYAERGAGSYLNNVKVKAREQDKIEDAFIAFELNIRGLINGYVSRIADLIERAKHVRLIGSDALELCFIASGTSDAFLDLRGFLRAPDFAASAFIVSESGGVVTDAGGSELDCSLGPTTRSTIVAACSKRLHEEIISYVRQFEQSRACP